MNELVKNAFDTLEEVGVTVSKNLIKLRKESERRIIVSIFAPKLLKENQNYIKSFKENARMEIEATKTTCRGFLNDLDNSIQGELSKKIQSELQVELEKYDRIVDENA